MIVFPAIDLKDGQVVRLAEGDMTRATIYAENPVAQAKAFAEAGAEHLHVVDLDGAFAGERRWRRLLRIFQAMCNSAVESGRPTRWPAGSILAWRGW